MSFMLVYYPLRWGPVLVNIMTATYMYCEFTLTNIQTKVKIRVMQCGPGDDLKYLVIHFRI